MVDKHVLGIDIAKATFDVALLPAALPASPAHERAPTAHFPNTPAGFAQLQAWLAQRQVVTLHACLEATSTYGQALATFLHAQGSTVSVVNPFQTKHHAQSELLRQKTDQVDARSLARFCRTHQPPPWTPPTAAQQTLQALVRRQEELQGLERQERNRRAVPGLDPQVVASIDGVLTVLMAQQTALQQHLRTLLAQTPSLAAACAVLCSIPGVGERTALVLVAELGDVQRFRDTRQAAAYAGLVPRHQRSGTSLQGKPRLSKQGNARLRKALYLPTLVATRCNPVLRAFYQQLLTRTDHPLLCKKAALGAVMHKLLKIATAILRSGVPFDPHHRTAVTT